MKYEYLLLDLDGTLLGSNSFKLNLKFIIQFVKGLGHEGIPWWRALRILHFLKMRMIAPQNQRKGVLNLPKSIGIFAELSGLSFAEAERILPKLTMQCFKYATDVFYKIPEANDFVAWAKPRYKLILATNPMWPEPVVYYRLGLSDIAKENFEFITHAENMSSCKPHVPYYEELVEKCHLDPAKCLMVGNDERKDGPARVIGIDVFIVTQGSDFKILQKNLESSL